MCITCDGFIFNYESVLEFMVFNFRARILFVHTIQDCLALWEANFEFCVN